jgi:hypothetical protein
VRRIPPIGVMDLSFFPLTVVMHLHHFKQIISVMNFNSNSSEAKCKDVMHNTRPILNILKKTLGAFIVPRVDIFQPSEQLWEVSFSVLYAL